MCLAGHATFGGKLRCSFCAIEKAEMKYTCNMVIYGSFK
jgi:hypothetical protein